MKIVQIQNAVFFIDEQMFEKKKYIFFLRGTILIRTKLHFRDPKIQTHVTSEERSSQFSMNMFP